MTVSLYARLRPWFDRLTMTVPLYAQLRPWFDKLTMTLVSGTSGERFFHEAFTSSGHASRMENAKAGVLRSVVLAICTAAAIALAGGSPAQAKGVTLIQQSNGAVRTYSGVYMGVTGQTVTLRSADRKGLLTIAAGACSFARDIERCYPYAVTLTQQGDSDLIALSHGTIFLNLANASHRLPLSSLALAPRTVLVVLKTAQGTYITAKGTLDRVKP